MAHAYYLSYARQYHGAVFAALLDETLVRLDASSAKALLKRCCPEIPEFSWQSLAAPISIKAQKNREAYQIWLRIFLEQDLVEARRGNVDSPLKAACDVLRDVRDNLRNAIDFGALSSDSHRAFMSDFVPVMNRLAVGPPLERIEEWLALAKAGYLDLGFGPGATLHLILNEPHSSSIAGCSPMQPSGPTCWLEPKFPNPHPPQISPYSFNTF